MFCYVPLNLLFTFFCCNKHVTVKRYDNIFLQYCDQDFSLILELAKFPFDVCDITTVKQHFIVSKFVSKISMQVNSHWIMVWHKINLSLQTPFSYQKKYFCWNYEYNFLSWCDCKTVSLFPWAIFVHFLSETLCEFWAEHKT